MLPKKKTNIELTGIDSNLWKNVGNQEIQQEFNNQYEGEKTITVELFPWEKLDYVDKIKKYFNL